jgi:hypothetical protein
MMLRKATSFLFILVLYGLMGSPELLRSAEKPSAKIYLQENSDSGENTPVNSLLEKTYGDEPFEFGPERTSEGLPLIYSSDNSDLLEFDGNVATIKGAGTAVVTVRPAGTDVENDGEPPEQVVTIQPAELEIAVDENQSKIYGDSDPQFTYTAEGFVYNDNPGLINGSLSRNEGEDAGEYEISGGKLSAGENYAVQFKSASFEIKQRELLVTAGNQQSKIYGEQDPNLEYSTSNFVDGDDESVFSGNLSREGGENAGVYTITGENLNAGSNYTIRFQPAEFTIQPRTLTLENFAAGDKIYDGSPNTRSADFRDNRLQGDVLEFSFTARFDNPDAETSKTVLFSDIEILGGSDRQNYTLNTESGTAQANILPRPITIRARPVEMIYGDEEPALEYRVSEGSVVEGDRFVGQLSRTGSTDAGNYEILEGSLNAGENYDITFQSAEFTIIQRSLQVVVDDNQSKIYGEADPELTFEAQNFAPGEDSEIFTGFLSRTSAESVGKYPIQQHALRAGKNYNIEFSPSEFEIKPKQLLVEVVRYQTKRYGGSDPTIRFTTDGFAFDDNESVLTGSPDRKKGENVGFYQTQMGDLKAGANYIINFKPAEFEIMPRPLVLTNFIAGDRRYDGTMDVSESAFQDNRIEGDKLKFEYKAVFDSPDAGRNLLVHFTDIKIVGGEDQQNYQLQTTSWSVLADITPRLLTVSAQPVNSVYGDENPEVLEYKITSGALLENDKIRGTLQHTGGDQAGVYEIRQGSLTAGENYKLDFKLASYTVKPKELTVTATGEPWKFEGQTDPDIAFSVDGFEYEDDASIIEGFLGREGGETPGEYQILKGTLAAGANYKIEVENADFSIFRTPPVALQHSPALDETRVAIIAPVTIQFDKSIILANADLISVTDPENREIKFRAEVEGNRMTLIQNEFVNHSTYTVYIEDEAVVNLDGIPNEEIRWEFTTIMLPPVVTTQTPADGAIGLGLSRPPVASFNQNVDAGNLSGITITRQSDGAELDVNAELEHNRLIIEHDGFEQFADYRVTIPENVVRNADLVGNEPYSWTFTTIWAEPEQVALQLPIDRTGSVAVQPKMEWEAALHADSYQIQVSTDIEFIELIDDSEITNGLSYELTEVLENNQLYFWRVSAKNSTSRSDWSGVRSFLTVAKTPEPVFPAVDADQVSIAPLLEWSYANNTTFRVQLSQSRDFSDPLINQLTDKSSIQLTGLEEDIQYFWRVRVESERTKSDWTNVFAFRTRPAPQIADVKHVLRERIEFGESAAKIQSEPSYREYRLVGLPGEDQYSVSDLFKDDYGTSWMAFRKVGSDDEYREYRQSDRNFTFTAGGGFWISGTKNLDLELPITSVETNKNDAYSIRLNPGWNIISNPHTRGISWGDVQVMNGIHGEIYSYSGFFSEADTLKPVHAYYYYNSPETALDAIEIPYSGMENRRKPDDKLELYLAASGAAQPSVKLHAEFDEENRMVTELLFPGLADNNSDFEEISRFQKYHPPMAMSRTGMMLVKPGTESSRGMMRDLAVYKRQGSEYRLHMKADKGTVFTWRAELSDMPDNTSILLVNEESDLTLMLEDEKSVEVAVEESEMTYKLFVGDRYWLEQKEEEYLPEDFALYPNYPNPFNAATTIRYSLPVKQEVRLEIFDVIGRRVQVLINDEQPAGWHTMQIDASRLASGVYVYQMTTKNNVSSRKMTIVK